MRGRIAFLNPATRTGLIYGADRVRYAFALELWQGEGVPARNSEVSFVAQAYVVTEVRPYTGEELEFDTRMFATPQPQSPVEPASADPKKRGKARSAPSLSDEMANVQTEDEDENPLGKIEYEELKSGEAFPELNENLEIRPQLGSMLFTQPAGRSSRSSYRYYLFGILAALLLVAIAYAVMHIM